jgi:hypothetical protein
MTPAEFDTRRRLLGLNMEETAEWCGANRVTVQRWIKGLSRIDPKAVARLETLENSMIISAENAVALIFGHAGPVPLIRYRTQAAVDAAPHASGMPLGAHAILIGWTADALEDVGHEVEIVWGD